MEPNQQQEVVIKNLDSGEIQNASELIRSVHQTIILNKTQTDLLWKDYKQNFHKIQQKLLKLVIKKDDQQLQNILKELPINLSNIKFMDGWSLLHFAVQSSLEVVEVLLRYDIAPDLQTQDMKRTPLHEAILVNRIPIVQLLIDVGANPNILDADRNSCLHLAVDQGYENIVELILQSKHILNIQQRNSMDMNPFNLCRSTQIFEKLISYQQKSKNQKSATTSHSLKEDSPQRFTYHSRVIYKNSDVIPVRNRADQIQNFLSLRQKKQSINQTNNPLQNYSIIQEIQGEDLSSSCVSQSPRKKSKSKGVGTFFKNSLMKSKKIAVQNIGLRRQQAIKQYLEHSQQIQSYYKLRKIGQGSFADVFLVRKKKTSKQLAMKKISKEMIIKNKLEDYIRAQKFVLTTSSNHPFILKAEKCLQDYSYLYIIMQYCEAGDLQKYVRKKKLDEYTARIYACEMALALHELHKRNILYRDLKVANTFVADDGHIKIGDFGLSKNAETSFSFLGSISYLAPEMLVSTVQKPHGKALDWYLFGIFIYELLSGYPPFFNENRNKMFADIQNSKVRFNVDISPQCKELLEKLLQKNPEKRLQNFQSIKQASWFSEIDWEKVMKKQYQVKKFQQTEEAEFGKKQFVEVEQDKHTIKEHIQWFDDWNYSRQ